ncbi:hypothetical protein [Flavobacterium sp.]|jgi:hypothetical protein|uniref:hypothetical protein n=1 Tax=Flavobacterium sp. TaxID=239 RepID=UPI0037C18B4E
MKIKYLVFTIFFLFIIQIGSAQTYKFITTGFSVMEKNQKGKWGKWSDMEKAKIIISLDTNKNRIIVYSQEVQLYNILEYSEKIENEDDIIYNFVCEDNDKLPFTISIITRKKQENRKQLYINQDNVIVVYNIENFLEKDK